MTSAIDADVLRIARSRYPRAYISGTGGPWGIVRFAESSRPAVVIFATEHQARQAAKDVGDAMIERFSTPIPENCPDLYPD
jgi:hypothetical protein